MRKRLFAGILAVCLLLSATSEACLMSSEERKALFERWDTDHDGTLTEQEYVQGETARLQARGSLKFHELADFKLVERYRDMRTDGHNRVQFDGFRPYSLTKCAG